MVWRTEVGRLRAAKSIWWRVRSKNRYGWAMSDSRKLRSRLSPVARGRRAEGTAQLEAAGGVVLQEEGHVLDAQRAHQAVSHGFQHVLDVGLRTQLPGELDQRAAVIVLVLVKEVAVQQHLNPVADGLEDEGGHEDQRHHGRTGQFIQAAHREDQAVEDAEHGERGQRVDVALLEDDVHVHQPVAQDGVAPGERHQDQCQHRHAHHRARDHPQQIGADIKDGERQHAQHHAVAQPLELVAQRGVVGAAVLQGEHAGAQQVDRCQVGQPGLVEQPAHLEQRGGRADHARTRAHIRQEDEGGRHVEQRHLPLASQPVAALGEVQAEVQEDGGREQAGGDVGKVDELVEIVELAGVVETGQDERNQAEDVEMAGLGCVQPAEINEQSDGQVGDADNVLVETGRIGYRLADDHLGFGFHVMAAEDVLGAGVGAQPDQDLGDLDGAFDGRAVDADQNVARADAGVFGRTVALDVERHNAFAALNPGDTILGELETHLLLEVDARANDRRHRQDDEDNADELALPVLHGSVLGHGGYTPALGLACTLNAIP